MGDRAYEAVTMAENPEIKWPAPPPLWTLGVREAHVWAVTLAQSAECIGRCAQALSPDEISRAERFHFERDRRRFIAGHGVLRAILGHYVGRQPAQIEFEYSPRGKPTLAESSGSDTFHFNLAHSDDLMLVAVTRGCEIGVDVERLRFMRDAEDVAERLFSARESTRLKALPEGQKRAAFFRLWTRKEACLKATGVGITESLCEAEVSFLPGEQPRLNRLFGDEHACEKWRLCELAPATGFIAALAVAAPDVRIKGWQWRE